MLVFDTVGTGLRDSFWAPAGKSLWHWVALVLKYYSVSSLWHWVARVLKHHLCHQSSALVFANIALVPVNALVVGTSLVLTDVQDCLWHLLAH